MLVELTTDNHIKGTAHLQELVENWTGRSLSRFSSRVHRLEVHLSDENGASKPPDDKRCALEARIEGHQPCAVVHHADTVEAAVKGAAHKLERMLDSLIGKMDSR
jgi:ribosome-associated translation inhibitor RaiA